MEEMTREALEALATVLPAGAVDMCPEDLRALLKKRKEENEAVAAVCRQALKAYYDDSAQRSQEVQRQIKDLKAEAERISEEALGVMDLLLHVGALGIEGETVRLHQRHVELLAESQAIAARIEALEVYIVPPRDDLFQHFIETYDDLRRDNAAMTEYVIALKSIARYHAQDWEAVLEADSSVSVLPNVGKISKHYYRRRPLPDQEEQGSGEEK